MSYINLRTNTAASLDYGFLDVEAALKKCQSEPSEYGMAFAVTERNNMYSVVDFYKKGQSISGFNPIVCFPGYRCTILPLFIFIHMDNQKNCKKHDH